MLVHAVDTIQHNQRIWLCCIFGSATRNNLNVAVKFDVAEDEH